MKLLYYFLSFLLITTFTACQSDSPSSYSSTPLNQKILLSDSNNTINESIAAGTLVGNIEIRNDGNILIEAIDLYGINSEYFDVNASGGIFVSSFAELEFSTKSTYTFEAIGSNEYQQSNRANVVINLNGTNLPRLQSVALNTDENASIGTDIGSIIIIEEGDSPIESITLSGDKASDFEVNSEGSVSISSDANLSFSNKNLYTLDATATSALGDSLAAPIIITLNDGFGEDSNDTDSNTTINKSVALLVIGISFSNHPIENSAENWNKKIFGTAFGQVNHYFREVSNSNFALVEAKEDSGTQDDGIIFVEFDIAHPGNNFMNRSHLAAAINLADEDINFAQYDLNSNSNIEADELQIMFIVGGGETAYGDPVHSSVWAHASGLSASFLDDSEAPPVVDGVTIMDYFANGRYSRFGEKHANYFASIGIIVHELGHSIWDLPDLYDRDQSSAGIGYFGLMAAGSWTAKSGERPGTTPPHMCAWSKLQLEWVEAQEVNQTETNIAIHANHTSLSNIKKIATDNPQEYFLLENRSPVGYDAALYTLDNANFNGGIAIWHIDESRLDVQNDEEHRKLVDLEEANNPELDSSSNNLGNRKNLFYSNNKAIFNTTSTPNSNTNDDVSTNINITNISAVGTETDEYIMYLDIEK